MHNESSIKKTKRLAAEDALDHYISTCSDYFDMFLPSSECVTAEEQERRLLKAMHARAYFTERLNSI